MGEKTIIAWTDHTWNLAWGCTKISPGCKNCYADTLSSKYGFDVWGKEASRRTFGEKHWREPVLWNQKAKITGKIETVFCSSMCDIFEEHPVIDTEREKLWPLIRQTPYLHWQLLTKRPERLAENLPADWGTEGYPNVWLGTSIENNDYVHRADILRAIPARIRFVSYEPALGPVPDLNLSGIGWLIYGGESGTGFRRHEVQWARDIRIKCQEAGTAFFYKQSSAYRTEMGIELDGEIVRNYPVLF